MILATDVYYFNDEAHAAGVLFENFTDTKPTRVINAALRNIKPYESGFFYRRELPCITKLLDELRDVALDTVVIDGFVYLDEAMRPGLGARLYEQMLGRIAVIGVAKSAFGKHTQDNQNLPVTAQSNVIREVLRGQSKKPLYVSAVGLNLDKAAQNIKNMSGKFRLPTLLKIADQESRRV